MIRRSAGRQRLDPVKPEAPKTELIDEDIDRPNRTVVGTPDVPNQAIGWQRTECSSIGGGTVLRFPRTWGLTGKCRSKHRYVCFKA